MAGGTGPTALIAILLLIPTIAWGAAPPAVWIRPIQLPDIKAGELISVRLDTHVNQHSAPQWNDLRVLDQNHVEQSYLLQPRVIPATELRRVTDVVDKPTARPTADALEIEFTIPDAVPIPEGITLITPLQNFERRVQVFAGNDPQPLVDRAVIFDYAKYFQFDTRNTEIKLPATQSRKFRLVIEGLTTPEESPYRELTRESPSGKIAERLTINERPFQIERVEVWHMANITQGHEFETRAVPASDFKQEDDPQRKVSVLTFSGQREPVRKLTLQTEQINFSRTVSVQANEEVVQRGTATDRWIPLITATVECLKFRGLDRTSLDLSFAEYRGTQLRLIVENRDNAPIQFSGVQTHVTQYAAHFLAYPGQTYSLVYGDQTLASPHYDLVPLESALKTGVEPVAVELGAIPSQPQALPPPARGWKDVVNNPVLLGGGVAVLVLLLGVGLYRAAKRLKDLPVE